MKKIILSTLSLLLFVAGYSQTIIETPKYGLSAATGMKIKKIELRDTATILYCNVEAYPGSWIFVPKMTYIQPLKGNNKKLFVKSADGIPLNKKYTMPESGEVNYALVFPKIENSVEKVDFGEANDGGNWFIYDIQVRPSKTKSAIHDELLGNWFKLKDAVLELSLFSDFAIYKCQRWNYGKISLKKAKGTIELKNETNTINLIFEKKKNTGYLIGESKEKLVVCSKNFSTIKLNIAKKSPLTDSEIFRLDTAVFSGYIKGFTPRAGIKTAAISTRDILTGEGNKYLIEIAENGFFSVKIPLYHPGMAYVQSNLFNFSIYLEPGKEIFKLIGTEPNLFMGETAQINLDYYYMNKILSFKYNDIQKKILDMDLAKYKEYFEKLKKKDLNSLELLYKKNSISTRGYETKKLDLKFFYAGQFMMYKWMFGQAYRIKHKIAWSQRNLPIEIEQPTEKHFNFITNELVNNPMAVQCPEYPMFINYLTFNDLLRPGKTDYTILDVIEFLKKTNYVLTKKEEEMRVLLEEKKKLNTSKEYKEFEEKYLKKQNDFMGKHKKNLQELLANGTAYTYYDIEKQLIAKKVKLTEEELQLIEAHKAFEKTELYKKLNENEAKNKEAVANFNNKHKAFKENLIRRKISDARNKGLKQKLGISPGLTPDVMTSQDKIGKAAKEMVLVSEEQIKEISEQVTIPFITEYAEVLNKRIIAKIEKNKTKTGYVINESPKVKADVLFDSIMSNYHGKVVYVDFWATWCGPCRSGMERIKPLKEELVDKDIVFVYITNPSSPKGTWKNFIPDVKGEHYRLTNDEWNYLTTKFNITGIPHYTLVGKNGEVINPKLGHLNNNALKKKLLQHLAD